MHSKTHAIVSALIGIVFAIQYRRPELVLIAVAAGVGIDFDHFLLAWYDHGDFRAAQRAVRHPEYVFDDQSQLFDEEASFTVEGGRITTLSVHTTEAFAATIAAETVCDEEVALTVLAAMLGHTGCDLYAYLR